MSKVRLGVLSSVVAGLVGVSGMLATAPAQAAESCNSTRVCFWLTDNTIRNIDPGAFFYPCSYGPAYFQATDDLTQARNRSTTALSVFLYKGSGVFAEVSQLDPGDTIQYTAGATYAFCIAGQ
ncbi:hypothetical protein ACWERV_13160 [Streptomyces sp. NPDC004031]